MHGVSYYGMFFSSANSSNRINPHAQFPLYLILELLVG